MQSLLFLPVALLINVLVCTVSYSQTDSKLPNDTRWVRESLEYKALCEQTYQSAWRNISKSFINNPQAVIVMDLDETVLDNSLYQLELFEKSETYTPDSWNSWVNKEQAGLVPGAKEFILNFKNKTKCRIVYISDRDAKTLKATFNNLKQLGVLFDDDIILLRKDNNDSKEIRREEVMRGTGRMKKYGPKMIMAYFGDQMGDFPKNDSFKFSVNKFIFPNPMYGKW